MFAPNRESKNIRSKAQKIIESIQNNSDLKEIIRNNLILLILKKKRKQIEQIDDPTLKEISSNLAEKTIEKIDSEEIQKLILQIRREVVESLLVTYSKGLLFGCFKLKIFNNDEEKKAIAIAFEKEIFKNAANFYITYNEIEKQVQSKMFINNDNKINSKSGKIAKTTIKVDEQLSRSRTTELENRTELSFFQLATMSQESLFSEQSNASYEKGIADESIENYMLNKRLTDSFFS
jgi:hypothetical protein